MAGKLDHIRNLMLSISDEQVEVIIVHDVRDKTTTLELAQIFKNGHPGAILVEGKFGSPGLARNAGFSRASGSWVWFCDSDDEPIVPVAILELAELQEDSDVVVFNYSRINEISREEITDKKTPDLYSLALNPGVWRILMKKYVVEEAAFSNLMLGEDQLFLIESGLFQKKIHFSEKIVYRYYFGGEGHLVDRRDRVSDLVQVFERTIKMLLNHWPDEAEVIKLMAIRQFMTIIKIGSISEKITTFSVALKCLAQKPRVIWPSVKLIQLIFHRVLTS